MHCDLIDPAQSWSCIKARGLSLPYRKGERFYKIYTLHLDPRGLWQPSKAMAGTSVQRAVLQADAAGACAILNKLSETDSKGAVMASIRRSKVIWGALGWGHGHGLACGPLPTASPPPHRRAWGF